MRNNHAVANDSLKLGAGDCLMVAGPLTFDNIVKISELGKEILQQSEASPRVIDLSGVTQAGSAGVSLMLSWARYARARRMEVIFRNVPPGLLGVAQVSGIDEILPIEQNQAA